MTGNGAQLRQLIAAQDAQRAAQRPQSFTGTH